MGGGKTRRNKSQPTNPSRMSENEAAKTVKATERSAPWFSSSATRCGTSMGCPNDGRSWTVALYAGSQRALCFEGVRVVANSRDGVDVLRRDLDVILGGVKRASQRRGQENAESKKPERELVRTSASLGGGLIAASCSTASTRCSPIGERSNRPSVGCWRGGDRAAEQAAAFRESPRPRSSAGPPRGRRSDRTTRGA